jgi:hypothetical protein
MQPRRSAQLERCELRVALEHDPRRADLRGAGPPLVQDPVAASKTPPASSRCSAPLRRGGAAAAAFRARKSPARAQARAQSLGSSFRPTNGRSGCEYSRALARRLPYRCCSRAVPPPLQAHARTPARTHRVPPSECGCVPLSATECVRRVRCVHAGCCSGAPDQVAPRCAREAAWIVGGHVKPHLRTRPDQTRPPQLVSEAMPACMQRRPGTAALQAGMQQKHARSSLAPRAWNNATCSIHARR